jgi:hypothetical protein
MLLAQGCLHELIPAFDQRLERWTRAELGRAFENGAFFACSYVSKQAMVAVQRCSSQQRPGSYVSNKLASIPTSHSVPMASVVMELVPIFEM